MGITLHLRALVFVNPQKRTWISRAVMSALCQKETNGTAAKFVCNRGQRRQALLLRFDIHLPLNDDRNRRRSAVRSGLAVAWHVRSCEPATGAPLPRAEGPGDHLGATQLRPPVMSGSGQKRTFRGGQSMSAIPQNQTLPSKRDGLFDTLTVNCPELVVAGR